MSVMLSARVCRHLHSERRVEADETYLLGIARKAAPLERLEAKHREFQKRMMASPTLPSSSSASSTTSVSPAAAPASAPTRRKPLGDPGPAASSSRARSTRAGSARNPSISEDVFSAPAAPRPNGRMPIFVDPSGDVENDPDQATNPTPWPELGTRKTRVKENTVEVSKAAGSTLRQAGRSKRAPSGSKIAVFRDPAPDEEPSAEMPPPPVPVAKAKGKPAGKSAIAIFRDEDEPASKPEPSVPSTPKFVPFKDEEVGRSPFDQRQRSEVGMQSDTQAEPSSAHPASVMKPKAAPAVKPVTMSAEAEALRKDPFKNYSTEEKPLED